MSYEIKFHPTVFKELKHLDKKLISQVYAALEAFADDQPSDYKKMKGFPNRYRIRIRDYRAVFDVIIQDNVMYVLRVAHRQEVYKSIEKL